MLTTLLQRVVRQVVFINREIDHASDLAASLLHERDRSGSGRFAGIARARQRFASQRIRSGIEAESSFIRLPRLEKINRNIFATAMGRDQFARWAHLCELKIHGTV